MSSLTVREALQRASSFMQSLDDGRFIAEILLRHVLGWDRTQLFTRLDESLSSEQWTELEGLVQKRVAGIPVQYLLGEQEFYGLSFKVNETVLIPRPETEILVEQVLRRRDSAKSLIVADIGTGSGAIAITLAVHSEWKVYAVDIAQESLDTAAENSRLNGVEGRITFLQGDLLSPLVEATRKVDILVSNPPYIPSRDIEELDIQVRGHEPRRALDGGADGLDFYRRICKGLHEVLHENGLVAFEVGQGQARDVEQLLVETGLMRKTEVICDLAGTERIVVGEGK